MEEEQEAMLWELEEARVAWGEVKAKRDALQARLAQEIWLLEWAPMG